MVRRDLGESVMEVSHTNGTDRWLVIKKELDSSKVTHYTRLLPSHQFTKSMAIIG